MLVIWSNCNSMMSLSNHDLSLVPLEGKETYKLDLRMLGSWMLE